MSTRVHPPDSVKVLECASPCLLDPCPFSWLDLMAPFIGMCDVSVLVGYRGLMP